MKYVQSKLDFPQQCDHIPIYFENLLLNLEDENISKGRDYISGDEISDDTGGEDGTVPGGEGLHSEFAPKQDAAHDIVCSQGNKDPVSRAHHAIGPDKEVGYRQKKCYHAH